VLDHKNPPPNAQRVRCADDLPQTRGAAKYAIHTPDGKTVTQTLCKRRRQVLELLMRGPVFCASPVRISDVVFVLKTKNGLDIETETYPGDPTLGTGDFGVYFLLSRVTRATASEFGAA